MAKHEALPYVAPFAVFLLFLAVRDFLPFGPKWEYPLRVLVVAAVLVLLSRRVVTFHASNLLGSLLVGLLVFVIWIGPDLLWPAYRKHWLFENALTGAARSSIPEATRLDFGFIVFRVIGTAMVVPIVEELFWRAWLMRYLISADFWKVPLGTYSGLSFWITALLFSLEHGPYWEVGLAAGIAYNWWMVRTRNLANCIFAHAITNGCLAIYVLAAGKWVYWL